MKTQRIKKYTKNKTRKTFLFNPENPDKSFDVYIDKNPKDTIPIKYTTISDVKNTIRKLEHLYKKKEAFKPLFLWPQIFIILPINYYLFNRR